MDRSMPLALAFQLNHWRVNAMAEKVKEWKRVTVTLHDRNDHWKTGSDSERARRAES